jgi:parallel beta-helix repeat protein
MTRLASCLGLFGTLFADLSLCGCGTNDHPTTPAPKSDAGTPSTESSVCTVTVSPGKDDQSAIRGALVGASSGDTICLTKGTYELTNQLSLSTAQVTLRGDPDTVLDFSGEAAQANGVEVTADGDVIDTLQIHDTKGDGLHASQVDGVTIRNVRVVWTAGPNPTNGGHGIYPVTSSRVLVEDCYVSGASDTGIYVGQSNTVVVRNSETTGNVAGVELENTTDAELYGNHSHDNAGGILIFNLPGPAVQDGKRANVHDNVVDDNNGMNFAATDNLVRDVPTGTGLFVLASDRNEIHANTVQGNDSVGIAVLSWFAALRDDEGRADEQFDWYAEGNYVHDNEMQDNGGTPHDRAALLAQLVGETALADVMWDGLVDWRKIRGDGGASDGAAPDGGSPASVIPDVLKNCFADDGSTFLDLDLEHDGKHVTHERGAFDCAQPSLSPIRL